MNQILKKLIEEAGTWPESDQAELAAFAQEIRARRSGVYELSDDERAAIMIGLAEADRGEFVSDKEMEAFWKKHLG
jgi:predicted transcriptional regulator